MQEKRKIRGFDADFDSFWKEVLDLIEPATSYFLPELHGDVDWTIEYKSLEQELRGPFSNKKGRNRRTDKLFRLQLKDGSDRFILFHIEAEAYPDSSFPKRMYEYYVYLSLKFNFSSVVMLGLFVGDAPTKAFNHYKITNYGTGLELHYRTFSVAKQSEKSLLQSENPIALAVLANLYVVESKGDSQKRYEFKRRLIDQLNHRGVTLEKFKNILNFALYLIRLPQKEESLISELILHYSTDDKITAMTNRAKNKIPDYVGMIQKNAFFEMYGESIEDAVRRISKEIDFHSPAEIEKNLFQFATIEWKNAQMLKKSEEERQKIKEQREKSVRNLYSKHLLSPEQIAEALEMEIATVNQILDRL